MSLWRILIWCFMVEIAVAAYLEEGGAAIALIIMLILAVALDICDALFKEKP